MKFSPSLIRSITTPATLALGLSAAFGVACGTVAADEDLDLVEQEIEAENGGLDMEDEAPLFGDDDIYSGLDLTDVETDIADAYASDTDVVSMMGAADAVVDNIVVIWEGEDIDREISISVDTGVLLAHRAIRLRGDDRVVDRTNRQQIEIRSRTVDSRPAGLRLRLAAASANAPGRILNIRVNGDDFPIDVDELRDDAQVRDVGTRGDRIIVVAQRRPAADCDNGFMRGQWLQLGRGFGALRARVANSDGDGIGHLRGLYGVRRDGSRVFFGKYINRAGQFKGIFAGKYRNGHFAGRWLARGGDHGVLGGAYRESLPGVRKGGAFVGRWAETGCNSNISDQVPSDR